MERIAIELIIVYDVAVWVRLERVERASTSDELARYEEEDCCYKGMGKGC